MMSGSCRDHIGFCADYVGIMQGLCRDYVGIMWGLCNDSIGIKKHYLGSVWYMVYRVWYVVDGIWYLVYKHKLALGGVYRDSINNHEASYKEFLTMARVNEGQNSLRLKGILQIPKGLVRDPC